MKQLILTLLLAFTQVSADDRQNYCSHMENIASAAMKARQANVPLSSMLALVSDETSRAIFIAAYELPLKTSASDQQAAVLEFSNSVLFHCLNS